MECCGRDPPYSCCHGCVALSKLIHCLYCLWGKTGLVDHHIIRLEGMETCIFDILGDSNNPSLSTCFFIKSKKIVWEVFLSALLPMQTWSTFRKDWLYEQVAKKSQAQDDAASSWPWNLQLLLHHHHRGSLPICQLANDRHHLALGPAQLSQYIS